MVEAGKWHALRVSVNGGVGETNSPVLVFLIAPGGFQTIGVVIDPTNYFEPPRNGNLRAKEVYPGIYVREAG